MKVVVELELTKGDVLTACQEKIKAMFTPKWEHGTQRRVGFFSACTVWDCCNLLHIDFMDSTEVGKFINLFHCVDFAEIEHSNLQKLQNICFALVGLKIHESSTFEIEYAQFEIVPNPKL
jgi:hypothetical protein